MRRGCAARRDIDDIHAAAAEDCGRCIDAVTADAHDIRFRPAIQEKLLDAVARFAACVQSAELALEIGKAEKMNRFIQ